MPKQTTSKRFKLSLLPTILLTFIAAGSLSLLNPKIAEAAPAACILDRNQTFRAISGSQCGQVLSGESGVRNDAYYLIVGATTGTGTDCKDTLSFGEITPERYAQIRDDDSTYISKSPPMCAAQGSFSSGDSSSDRIKLPEEDKRFQCGKGPDAVKVSFNFGCVGEAWNPDKPKATLNPVIDMAFGITRALTNLVGVVLIIMIIVAGIKFSAAQGDPQATAKAIAMIRNAVIALVAYMFVFALLQWLVPGGVFN